MSGPAKRPRREPKAFDDCTVAELRALLERNDAAQLREAQERIAELEKKLAAAESEVNEYWVNPEEQAEMIKRAISKQFEAMMLSDKELSEKEGAHLRDKGEGREVSIVIPNVSPDVMKELGLQFDADGGIKSKYAYKFFDVTPAKSLVTGASLLLNRTVSFKYVKTKCELTVSGTYKWSAKPKPKAKAKAKLARNENATQESAQEEEEGDAGIEEEGAAEEAGEKAEAMPAPSPAKSPTPARAAAASPAAASMDVE